MLFYYIFRVIIFPLAIMPYAVLYKVSDGLFLLTYHVIGYRKKLVFDNLSNSFPEKTKEEILEIRKQFYRNFCDLIVESIKSFHVSDSEIVKRCTFDNRHVVNQLYENHPCVIALASHTGNWEFAGISVGLHVKFFPVGSYKPLSSKGFNKVIEKMRGAYMDVIPYYNIGERVKQSVSDFKEGHTNSMGNRNRKPVFIFVADQAPSKKNSTFWTTFLNQETAFYTKIEDESRQYNLPVIFCEIQRIRRGYFNLHVTLLAEHASETEPFAITSEYARLLDECIKKNPANWLWTHRRWKRKRENPDGVSY